jgi:hypothetical protein
MTNYAVFLRVGWEIPVAGIHQEIPSWEILYISVQVGNMIFRCN